MNNWPCFRISPTTLKFLKIIETIFSFPCLLISKFNSGKINVALYRQKLSSKSSIIEFAFCICLFLSLSFVSSSFSFISIFFFCSNFSISFNCSSLGPLEKKLKNPVPPFNSFIFLSMSSISLSCFMRYCASSLIF